MLIVDDAVPFLLESGLIDRNGIIDGTLTVRCSARRNRNLKIEGPNGTGLLVKQPDEPAEGGFETLRSEAAFYVFCQGEPTVAAMASVNPHLSYYDADRALLVLELVSDAVAPWTCYEAHDAWQFPFGVGEALGQALGSVHRLFRQSDLLRDPRLAWLERPIPWVMTMHRPSHGFVADLSPANVQLIRILQMHDGLAERLDRLRGQWRDETVIHGDIKSDNILVRRSRQEPSWEIRIIDWELVQIGDPAWDLAGALQDFVGFWVNSMPLTDDMSIDARAVRARYPLDVVQEAIRSTWRGYRAELEPVPDETDELLDRAVAFSAARMIQTAFELSYDRAELAPRSVVLLQVGANILADPACARVQLYGLPPRATGQ
jgi:hypothetical protein